MDISPVKNYLLLAGADDSSITLFNIQKSNQTKILKTFNNINNQKGITVLKFLDKDKFVSGSKDKLINFWDIKKEKSLLNS